MPINFDSLPTECPNVLPEAGIYLATIAEATVKVGKTSGNEYIELKLTLSDKTGKTYGTIYDSVMDSDKAAIQYKLGRFIRACGIPLTGSMELRDIVKLIPKKVLTVQTKIDPAKDGYAAKAVVDLFGGEVYWKADEYDSLKDLAKVDTTATAPESDFMNIPDGAGADGVPFDGTETPTTPTSSY